MTVTYGLAIENFTSAEGNPNFTGLIDYARTAERLGFRSLWAWDHLFLGSKQPFPCFEALSTLTTLAAHTSDIELGTGVLVLPIRDPALLAKTAATLQATSGGRLTLGVAAGWYEREFAATGSPFRSRGKRFERNLDLCYRLWTDDEVTGEWDELSFRRVRMLPRPSARPKVLIGGYVDRVLRRVATMGDGWLTYFYRADAFARSWKRITEHAEDAGRDPAELTNVAQLPICVDSSFEEADRKVGPFLAEYFDNPEWSDATPESAIRGTPEQCAEQLTEHIEAGVAHIALVPHRYLPDQVERIAAEVLPLLPGAAGSPVTEAVAR
ncbi:LLM class F420-dependent oxidoreductase [Prauserella marina]|uniref:Alkanesulfonate monooxygenase n=1 Tax=Prauserella marina TaxID=530584 RepID=A0A222VQ42_9PSEU|nr:TIGR03619 family F420-dependent LLM class oxidoreductase [Prauserella marina]ASR36049.1 LLM class F420-dependent oxidoreductase [Prauserella marina]PWV83994.1 alkanesulfonate monooxygenase [Prauserella marina]SDC32917.1 alkanesulfonate monooxygenase [Prauserella marina]